MFITHTPKPTGANQEDPTATPVATSLGLPSGDPDPQQIPHPLPLERVAVPEPDAVTPTSPATHSPSLSIATLSDFTIADTSDDESPIDTAIAGVSDNEPPVGGPAATAQHETFYLQDGNVEVLCGNTLFCVHTSTLSSHSPALRRMFAQTWIRRNHQMVAPVSCPRTPPRISPPFSR